MTEQSFDRRLIELERRIENDAEILTPEECNEWSELVEERRRRRHAATIAEGKAKKAEEKRVAALRGRDRIANALKKRSA